MSDAGLVTLSGQVQTLDGQVVGAAEGLLAWGSLCGDGPDNRADTSGPPHADCLWYETTMERWARGRERTGVAPAPGLGVVS